MRKILICCVFLLILVSVGAVSWEKYFGPIRGLTDEDPKVRRQAVERLATSWVPDRVARLTVALKDADVEVRTAAALALGKIGTPAFGPLMEALHHEDIRVRRGAASAVGYVFPALEDREARAKAIKQLVYALKDCDLGKRVWLTLSKGQPLAAVAMVAPGVHDGDAVTALGAIGEPALGPLIDALEDEDVRVRQRAAVTMGLVLPAVNAPDTRVRAAEALIRAMKDPGVRMYANGVLLTFLKSGIAAAISVWHDEGKAVPGTTARDSDTPATTAERLIRVMADREEMRGFGAAALGKIGEPAIEPLLAALQDQDTRVRTAAVVAMQQVLPGVTDPATRARAIEPLIRVLKEDEKGWISYVPHMLAEIGEPALEPLLRIVFEEGGGGFARAALRQMVGTGENAELTQRVMARLIDRAEEGNSAAAFALGEVFSDVEDPAIVQISASALVTALEDDHPDVRREAALGLGQILSDAHDPETIQAAALSLIAKLNDDRSDVRACAASALGHILGGGEDPQITKEAIEALLTALENDSAVVRLHVVGALGRSLSRVAEPTLGRRAVMLLLAMLEDPDATADEEAETRKIPGLLIRKKTVLRQFTRDTVRVTNILQKDLEAFKALGRIIAGLKSAELAQTAVPPLIEALEHDRQPYRFSASSALIRIVSAVADPELARTVIPPLITALADKDRSVREHAAEAFGRIFSGAAEPELAQKAMQPLVAALEDNNMGVRNRAAWALVKIGTEQAKDAVRNAGFDPDRPPSVPKRQD